MIRVLIKEADAVIYALMMEKVGWLFLEWRRLRQKRISPYGLTIQQYSILKQLTKSDYLAPSDIAEWLHCDRPTASVIIKNLEKKEWIDRCRDEQNAKRHRIFITEQGKVLLQRIENELPDSPEQPFDVLTEEECAAMLGSLRKACKRMKILSAANTNEGGENEEDF